MAKSKSAGAGEKTTRAQDEAVWRLLDANANRAREGLRILEDTARFVLNQAAHAKGLRALRHALDALTRVHYHRLLSSRDVLNDSGRSNSSGVYPGGVADLLAANFKRCAEALRVLEEYGKVLSPQAVHTLQKIRFEIYDYEKKLAGQDRGKEFKK